jgi:hypothetical protein
VDWFGVINMAFHNHDNAEAFGDIAHLAMLVKAWLD